MAFKGNSGKLKTDNHYAENGIRKDSLCKKKKQK